MKSKLYAFLNKVLGTKIDEIYWITRHFRMGDDQGNKDNECVIGYWNSRSHGHRSFLVKRIARFSPETALEIGCNCGPNLYLLAKKFPNAKLVGIDINPVFVQRGKDLLKKAGISNVKLFVGKADNLSQFQDKSFDVVLTDSVLIYIGRDKIKKTIKEMLRVARKGLVMFEWHSTKSDSLGALKVHWVRNYVSLLKEFVPQNKVKLIRIPAKLSWQDKNWQKWGKIIEVTLTS